MPAFALIAEAFGLFAVPPLLVLWVHQRWFVFFVLWGAAVGAYGWLRRQTDYDFRVDWNAPALRAGAPGILRRFAVIGPALMLLTAVIDWHQLFILPRERPMLWLLILVLYPVLSVVPQEIVFRSFFLRRYAPLMGSQISTLLMSAACFGFAHVFLANVVAPPLTALAGALFASTYQRHRSLALVSAEHALYGLAIFTVGLGRFFFARMG